MNPPPLDPSKIMSQPSSSVSDAKSKAMDRFKDILESEAMQQANTQVLIPSSSHYSLGPIYTSNPPAILRNFFLPKEVFLYQSTHDIESWRPSTHLRSWPSASASWNTWFDRVASQKASVWKQNGLFEVLQFSQKPIAINSDLILAASCFWSPSTNSLHLSFGMSSPNLLDMSALIGLRPDGEIFSANTLVLNPADDFGLNFSKTASYSFYMENYNRKDGPVTDQEYIAFFLVWICKYLLCNRSLKIVKAHLRFAVFLAQDRPVALGPLVLAYLYRGLHDLVVNFGNSGGPIWIFQLWLYAHFPEVRPTFIDGPSLPIHGWKYAFPQAIDRKFPEYFTTLYSLPQRRPSKFFLPYIDSLLPWLEFTNISSSNLSVWTSFLVARDLHTGTIIEPSYNNMCSVEFYCPHFCSRQFGLTQDVPCPPYFSFNDRLSNRVNIKDPETIRMIDFTNHFLSSEVNIFPYEPKPSTTSTFEQWWSSYIDPYRVEKPEYILAKIWPIHEDSESSTTNSVIQIDVQAPVLQPSPISVYKEAIPLQSQSVLTETSRRAKATARPKSRKRKAQGSSDAPKSPSRKRISTKQSKKEANSKSFLILLGQNAEIEPQISGAVAQETESSIPRSTTDPLVDPYVEEELKPIVDVQVDEAGDSEVEKKKDLAERMENSSDSSSSDDESDSAQAEELPVAAEVTKSTTEQHASQVSAALTDPNPLTPTVSASSAKSTQTKNTLGSGRFLGALASMRARLSGNSPSTPITFDNSKKIKAAKALLSSLPSLGLDASMEAEMLERVNSAIATLLVDPEITVGATANLQRLKEKIAMIEVKLKHVIDLEQEVEVVTGESNKASKKIEALIAELGPKPEVQKYDREIEAEQKRIADLEKTLEKSRKKLALISTKREKVMAEYKKKLGVLDQAKEQLKTIQSKEKTLLGKVEEASLEYVEAEDMFNRLQLNFD